MKKVIALILVLAISLVSPLCYAFADDYQGYDFSNWDDGQIEFLSEQVKGEMSKRGLAAPEQTSDDWNLQCTKCGKSVPNSSSFCLYCGTPLRSAGDSSTVLQTETGRAEIIGLVPVPAGFLSDEDADPSKHTIIVVKYTNFTDEERQFQNEFQMKAYQNGTELSHAGSYRAGVSQEVENFFKNVILNGSVTIGRAYVLEDTSDITVIVSTRGSSDKKSVKAVFPLGTAAPISSGSDAVSPDAPVDAGPVLETPHMKINGFCVDDSYRDSDNSPLRMVYLFYTLTSTDTNLKIDSKDTKLTVNGINEYSSAHYSSTASATEFMPNYLYSSTIKQIYVGSSANVTATFEIPEGDLIPGKSVTLSDSQNPDAASIRFSTDDLQHFNSGEEIARTYDPEGYQSIQHAYEDADYSTAEYVKSLVNGYYWWCYQYNTKYEVEFYAPNSFEVRTSLGTANSGTYTVKNGYLFCTYDSNDKTLKIPYVIKNGDIEPDLLAAFDVTG